MKLIHHPSLYQRQYQNDLPNQLFGNYQKIVLSTLPLLSLNSTLQRPLGHALNGMRIYTHLNQLKSESYSEIAYEALQSSLACAGASIAFFKPAQAVALSTVSDILSDAKQFQQALCKRDTAQMLSAFVRLSIDVSFLASIAHGGIEFTVLALSLQILESSYQSLQALYEGEYTVAALRFVYSAILMHRLIPQTTLLHWKYTEKPDLNLALKKTENGFVYLDVKDDDCKRLYSILKDDNLELPPYFLPKKAGAHVSVIYKGESQAIGQIKELGQTFPVTIHGVKSLNITGWDGVDRVKFLTLHCPKLDALRASYGLSERIGGDHDWHLTFGIERTNSLASSA